MKKFIVICLALFATTVAGAQTPASNWMPDGSRDMYIGLGAISRPSYDGAAQRKIDALPVLQMQWSNGVFVSGMSVGWHLSDSPQQEFGPLLVLEPGRTSTGIGRTVGSLGTVAIDFPKNNTHIPSSVDRPSVSDLLPSNKPTTGVDKLSTASISNNKLVNVDEIPMRILMGGFYHFKFTNQWRLSSNLLYGAGKKRDGLRVGADLRYGVNDLSASHKLTLSVGLTAVNQSYNQAYFGIRPEDAARTALRIYSPDGGVKDLHADIFWNWHFNPSLLLTTRINATRLVGDAGHSPLVEKRHNFSFSSALAYRF